MVTTARPERVVLAYQEQIGFQSITALNGARIILPHYVIENGIIPYEMFSRTLENAVKARIKQQAYIDILHRCRELQEGVLCRLYKCGL